MSKEERKKANDSLQTTLERFTTQIRAEDKYFDPSLCWIDAAHVKQSDLAGLVVDKREWGDYVAPDAVADSDDSDDDSDDSGEDDDDLIDPETEEPGTSKVKSVKAKGAAAKKLRAQQQQQQQSSAAKKPASKLRPALDILNRLRWDQAFDPSDYMIGYEDRFLGVKETPLESWKGEQTDEEFIPLHRVVYFRRRADRSIVWDRRTRKDVIFGSGMGGE